MAYSASSPYHSTSVVNGQFLDVMTNRPITGDASDQYWTINTTYNLRPDLLASDLYGDSKLWWVFAQRNPNTIKDPLGDFVTGTSIYLPKFENIQRALGI